MNRSRNIDPIGPVPLLEFQFTFISKPNPRVVYIALKKPRIIIVQVAKSGEIESYTDEKGKAISDKEVQARHPFIRLWKS